MAADAAPFALLEQLDPDLVLQVLAQLRAPHHVAVAGAVNKRLRHLSASDILWRELCARRWENRLEAAAWLERATTTAPLDTQHGHWREQFALREHEICAHYPVFLMGGRLQLGVANGLHLFEPRCGNCWRFWRCRAQARSLFAPCRTLHSFAGIGGSSRRRWVETVALSLP